MVFLVPTIQEEGKRTSRNQLRRVVEVCANVLLVEGLAPLEEEVGVPSDDERAQRWSVLQAPDSERQHRPLRKSSLLILPSEVFPTIQ